MQRSSEENTHRAVDIRRVAVTSCVGTTLEWYDFFIYSTSAALIFSSQFFPNVSGTTQTLAALSTITIGYVARPLGSIVFGHYGDRLGRKKLLVLSLLLMGVSTFATGLLPNFGAIGIWAPVLLVSLRFLQGVALGGEWGGAVLMAVEHAPKTKRSVFGALPQLGAPLGFILSTLVFLIPSTTMSESAFASWGWRIPFLLSIFLVGVGLYLRLRVMESPAFRAVEESNEVARFPILEVLKTSWKKLLIGAGVGVGLGAAYFMYTGYVLTYGTKNLGMGRNGLLWATLAAAVAMAITIAVGGSLADRFGNRRMCLIGIAFVGLWAFPSFWLIDSKNIALVAVALIVGLAAVGLAYGPLAALYAELFDTRMRYSGAGLTYMLMGLLSSGIAPLAAPSLLGLTGSSSAIALYMLAMAVIGLVCTPFAVARTRRVAAPAIPDPAAVHAAKEGV